MSDAGFVEVSVPSILGGESISEGSVKKVRVQVGQVVSQDDVMFEIETDKTILEVNAPKAGKVVEIQVSDGDTVLPSQKVAVISTADVTPTLVSSPVKPAASEPAEEQVKRKNSPAADVIMNNMNISASDVKGSGLGSRITKADVIAHLDSFKQPEPKIDDKPVNQDPVSTDSHQDLSSADSREERVRMSKIRQITARRLKDAQNTAAILTTFNEVDLSNLMQLRSKNKDAFEKKLGTRLSFMSFFIKAVVSALKVVPEINAEIIDNDIVYKYHYDIGVAVGSERGLVVPVIRNVDSMSFTDIESAMSDFASRARDGKLKVSEMSGATFTISNGGVYGSLLSTPIINPPQSGILGMHAIKDRAVVVDGNVCVRPMMYVALSYDHRIVDGKGAVTFLVHVKDLIEDPSKILLGF